MLHGVSKGLSVFRVSKASTPGVHNFFCGMVPFESLVECTDPLSEKKSVFMHEIQIARFIEEANIFEPRGVKFLCLHSLLSEKLDFSLFLRKEKKPT